MLKLEQIARQHPKFEFDNDNEMVGKGIFLGPRQFENQIIYIGQWYDHKRNGRGQQIYPDGSIYEGYWLDDTRSGNGRFIDYLGDIYEGEWQADVAQGKGKYIQTGGAVYQGDWVDNKQNGQGREKWPSGETYEGDYKDGQKHGQGLFKQVDSSYYYGQFVHDKITGNGRLALSKANITGKMDDSIPEIGKITKKKGMVSSSGLTESDTLANITTIIKKAEASTVSARMST